MTRQADGVPAMDFEIRAARAEDAEAIAAVLERSITELCVADHENDPGAIADWLTDKTPAAIRAGLAAPGYHLFVAVENHRVIGVCAVQADGEIKLNYVAPEARFRGISKAMMIHLENHARALGLREVSLAGTKTAHRFYLDAGYIDSGLPTEIYGIC